MNNQELFQKFAESAERKIAYNTESYDKTILVISIATLFLSMFLTKLPHSIGLLITAMVFFTMSIALTLSSFITGDLAFRKSIIYAERYYIDNEAEYWNKKSWLSTATMMLNYLSGAFCIIGLVLVIIFVSVNM